MALETAKIKKMKVLVVEDSEGMRKLVADMLETIGFGEVLAAANGAEAWEKIQAEPVDILMTDRKMPGGGGVELVLQVREAPQFATLPVLMFSAHNEIDEVRDAIGAGVNSYLAKPFRPQQLRDKLDELLGKNHENRIERIVRGSGRYPRDAKSPVVILGEGASTRPELKKAYRQKAVDFLWRAVSAIDKINASDPDIAMGYELESRSAEITNRLRKLEKRAKMMIVSSEVNGCMTLVRLASINKEDLTIVLAVGDIDEVPEKELRALQELGVFVLERDEMPQANVEQLMREFAVAKAYTPARQGVPRREEMRRRIESDIDNLVSLPVLPEVFKQIGQLEHDTDSDIREWASIIDRDPLASAMVVRRASSPVYGFVGTIDSTRRAVTLLGKKTVKDLIVSQAVKRSFRQVTEKGLKIEEYWNHSLAVALTARLLGSFARKGRPTDEQDRDLRVFALDDGEKEAVERLQLDKYIRLGIKDDAFGAGLMHDIGKVAMVVSYPGLFPELVAELEERSWRIPMIQAEAAVAGSVDHCLVGGLLAEKWGQPRATVKVISDHHDPDPNDGLTQLVALADFIGGSIYPFPSQARFPAIDVIASGAAHDPETMQAIGDFLPEGLLRRLHIQLDDLLQAGKVLAPHIRKMTEEWRGAH